MVCRDFLQLVSVPRPEGQEQGPGAVGGGEGDEVLLEYDVEWLSIVQESHYLLSNSRGHVRTPFFFFLCEVERCCCVDVGDVL